MMHSVKKLEGFHLRARDGEIGRVKDVYFDDDKWVIRYLVVDTGGWLTGRQVLISPHSITGIDTTAKEVAAALTREQVENAPGIETDKPVSRQQEAAYHAWYGYPTYWGGSGLWGGAGYPLGGAELENSSALSVPTEVREREAAERAAADPHLRSSNDVIGYHIEATDGSIGHIEDFLFDDRSWAIRYAAVDTRNWLPGKHVLVAPDWIDGISWADRTARFNVTRDAVESSPPYDRDAPLAERSVEEDERLHRHYGRPTREE